MIFALADYVRYRLRKGRYNPAVLEEQGWVLASRANFQGDDLPAPGLVCVVHTQDSFVSWVIMYFSQHAANHVFIFGEEGSIVDTIPTAGVIERPLSDYLDERSYFLIVPKEVPSAEKRTEALSWAKTQIGNRYGWPEAVGIGERILYGRPHPGPAVHWRLWTDAMIVLAILSVPRRWISWWPDVLVRLGHRYLRELILNLLRLDVERPSDALVMAFEPTLARKGLRISGATTWSDLRHADSSREHGRKA
ncbi:MAG TPA: hypothetical protein VNY35_06625 [Solirubrobacteraceae bacterium]|jgi:hypothetical protein|nr:hypothetical protein [Solirubrobacteraceae bacterium]